MPEPGHGHPPAIVVTADDLIRGGLCREGVLARLGAVWRRVAAAMTLEDVLRLALKGERERILRASGAEGYGEGCGDGMGYGYGGGDGYWHSEGCGYGYGYDNGMSYGYGKGMSYGYGNGDSYGYGVGYCDGIGESHA